MDHLTISVKEMFPNISLEQIQKVSSEITHYDDETEKINAIIDKLSEIKCTAAGAIPKNIRKRVELQSNHVQSIQKFSKLFTHGSASKVTDVDETLTADCALSELYARLQDILPDAEPNYLMEMAKNHLHGDEQCLDDFIIQQLQEKNYPKIDSEKIDDRNSARRVKFTSGVFDIDKFLLEVPNPEEYFAQAEDLYNQKPPSDAELTYTIARLCNIYTQLRRSDIEKIFKSKNYNVIATCNRLDHCRAQNLIPRKALHLPPSDEISEKLLHTLLYSDHRHEVLDLLSARCQEREDALRQKSFLACMCCFGDGLITADVLTCMDGHTFCKECVKMGGEQLLAQNKFDYKCLADCTASFSDSTLQTALEATVYERILQRRQAFEVSSANIEGLETCPFCDYATIPSVGDKLFHCENARCGKVSCRECRHESHVPLRCREIEYDEDVRMRTEIENRMSEAMVRRCRKCNTPLMLIEACNKIVCSCGATSCFACGELITNYDHFERYGGNKCPLYSNIVNEQRRRVVAAADGAKRELGITENPDLLKFDPTRDL